MGRDPETPLMAPLIRDAPTMSNEEFTLLRDIIGARTGLCFAQDLRAGFERRLRERLAARNLRSFTEYYQHLRFHPLAAQEWDEVCDLLTTNETYFYREDYQLLAFRDELLPMLAEQVKGRKRLAVWSAGCSTGEEAYTIAILIKETNLFAGWDVAVYGSDISRRCIAIARKGLYGQSSFRAMPSGMRRAYFVERSDGAQVVESIRSMCHFNQMNLLEANRARLLGRVDAVFCRNMLIYLDAHSRRKVIDMFHERLFPGGVLLLGHSESLLNVTTAFELLHLKGDLVYRKPESLSRPVSV
jgi:chemotaxis protein methyltransferase CheR